MLATETLLPAPVPDKIKNYNSRNSTMPNNAGAEGDEVVNIKNAVRDAARKTQERLAAYQQRQSIKAAAAVAAEAEKANAAPSKEKLQVESTVTRLQALVSESKRLTNKSKELNAAPPISFAAAAPAADEAKTIKDNKKGPDLMRCMSLDTGATAMATPKGRKLSEIMQHLHPAASSSSTGLCKSAVPTSNTNLITPSVSDLPQAPSLTRASSNGATKEKRSSSKRGEKLGALFQKLNGSQSSLHNSSSSLPNFSDHANGSSSSSSTQKNDDNDDSLLASSSGSSSTKKRLSRDDSVQALLGPIVASGLSLDKFASSSQRAVVEAAKKQQEEQQQVLASLSVIDVAEVKFDDNDDDDNSDNQDAREDEDDNSHSSGELSILNLVEDAKKKKEIKINGMKVDLEDAEEEIEDYYNSSQASLASQLEELGSSLPCLEHMGENGGKSSKSKSSKKKGKSPKKKEKKEDANNSKTKAPPLPMEDKLPFLEDILETPKQNRPKLTHQSMSAMNDGSGKDYDDDDDEFLDASMPTLDPFLTPNGFKPKIVLPSPMNQEKDDSRQSKWSKKLSAINKNLEASKSKLSTGDAPPEPDVDAQPVNAATIVAQSPDQQKISPRIEEGSMNLSQVFPVLSEIIPDRANAVRRPSLEHVQEEEDDDDDDDDDKMPTSSGRSRARNSRGRSRDNDGNASARSSRSKSSARSHRSTKSKNNVPPQRKKSFKDTADDDDGGESSASSKPAKGEKKVEGNAAPRPGMDVSELSVDESTGMRDGSDLSSSSRSARRGRSSTPGTLGGESGHSQRSSRSQSVKRGVSRSASTRSQSRSASVRRRRAAAHPRPNKADSMEDGSMQNSSMRSQSFRDSSRRKTRDSNASLRDGSFRDGSRRRRSISTRRVPGRRSQRRVGDDDDQSVASTADEVLSSLDVSEIEIIGEVGKGESSPMPDDSRSSIYDKKQKRPSVIGSTNKSLAGLSQLESAGEDADKTLDESGDSVSDSVQSSATKKSRMSKFAKSVGRKLKGKKGKSKKETDTAAEMATAGGVDDSSEGDEDEMNELMVDNELAALAAEYDAEEEELENGVPSRTNSFESTVSGDDPSEISENAADDNEVPKSKKKARKSVMFSAIKKVGKLTKKKKKKKKKNKKDKNSEALDSDSESESEGDELRGSENSAGTLDQSVSDEGDQSERFAQVQFDGGEASVSISGADEAEEAVPNTPTRNRPRRASAVNMRRQRADKQRAQSLHAVLGNSVSVVGDDDNSVQGSVKTTDTRIRSRRAQSLRGRIQRTKGDNGNTEDVQAGSKKGLKGRIEVNPSSPNTEKSKRIRRAKSAEIVSAPAIKNIEENEVPAFDWQAYSADTKKAAPAKKARDRRKSTKAKELDKRMSGGLSKVIYHQQGVAN